ncbi:hypothetical protein P4H71_08855 [Paenibacillus kribbensis]|nr:hypothetical protein [Paenibacillus kribbensis]MEC0234433.1 hypothetical protein [Paenibacillus kribbensis]
MGHWFYITPDEYAEAEKIGIKPTMLDRRVRQQGWPKHCPQSFLTMNLI